MWVHKIIRDARKRKGLTQQQLADAIGVSVMSIRRYETITKRVRRTPTIDECKKIADVLDAHDDFINYFNANCGDVIDMNNINAQTTGCPYCDDSLDMRIKSGYKYLFDTEYGNGFVKQAAMISCGKLYTNTTITNGDDLNIDIDINYCPMCGRKLK